MIGKWNNTNRKPAGLQTNNGWHGISQRTEERGRQITKETAKEATWTKVGNGGEDTLPGSPAKGRMRVSVQYDRMKRGLLEITTVSVASDFCHALNHVQTSLRTGIIMQPKRSSLHCPDCGHCRRKENERSSDVPLYLVRISKVCKVGDRIRVALASR